MADELWYGYLEAKGKSSYVLLDRSLDTANPKTMYLFNQERGQILEYSREIAEKKVRELRPDEAGRIAELRAAFGEARRGFRPRALRSSALLAGSAAARAALPAVAQEESPSVDTDLGPAAEYPEEEPAEAEEEEGDDWQEAGDEE
jgi:hypothetical protein